MASQSWSVWSLCRYRIPRFSRSASISSGIRPFTRTAYIPRAYFAVDGEVSQTSPRNDPGRVRTCSLPPRHPAAIRINHRDDTLEERSCTIGDSFWVALQLKWGSIPPSGLPRPKTTHLKDLLAVRAPIFSEVRRDLNDRTQKASTQLLRTSLGGDGGHGG